MKKYIPIILGSSLSLILFIIWMFFVAQIHRYEYQAQKNTTRAQEIYDAMPSWHKKIQTDQVIKIGFITDTHVHATRLDHSNKRDDSPRKLKDDEKEPIDRFVAQMSEFQPEFIVHGGDVIEGTNDDYNVGSKSLLFVKKYLEEINLPIHWVVGNHDLRSLTKDQFKELSGIKDLNYSFDIGDYRFVVVDANFNPQGLSRSPGGNSYIPGYLPENSLTWLKEQLSTDKRTIIFIHQGTFLDKSMGDISNNSTAEIIRYQMKRSMPNANELIKILKEYRVDAIFNGHMEARRYEVINFTTHYSFTGTLKSELYPQSFYEITINGGKPDVTMYHMPTESKELKKEDFERCTNTSDCIQNK